jgi:outer membrane protein assembly factor BamB
VTYGWASAYGYQQLTSYDLNAAVDPRLAGANGMVNNASPAVFEVDLPAPGTYNVSLAIGLSDGFPACNYSPCQVEFRDGSTSLFVLTIPTAISPLGAIVDANGITWSAAAWPASNTTRQITLTGTHLTVLLGTGTGTSSGGSFLSFLGITTSSSFAITPRVATLTVGQQQQFTANISPSWSVDGIPGGNTTVGTISSLGLYTAPSTSGSHTVTATGSGMTATAQVYVSNNAGVFTDHNDNARTGQNTQEIALSPANVNWTHFGKLLSVPVVGNVYAQPLYVSNLNFSGTIHNVVYVATEHDSLYAIDADNGTILWQLNLIPSGASSGVSSDVACTGFGQEIGITGTPVIDPASGTIYLVTVTKENGAYVQRLHAIDLINHSEKFGGPVAIQASVTGTGSGSIGGVLSFDPMWELQRPGLLLQNGQVSIGWAGYCEGGPYHGWLIAYNAANLTQQVGAFSTTPNGPQGGIWMGAGGLVGDANFNTYFGTGNGDFDGKTEFGDSILKLGPPSNDSFPVADWFTPFDQAFLDVNDVDLGSGGVLLLPDLPAGSPHQHLLVEAGKEGTIYLVDRDNMGKYCPPTCTNSDPQIVQELQKVLLNPLLGTPAYWNGKLYFAPASQPVLAFSFNSGGSGLLSTSPIATGSSDVSGIGSSLVVSANGNTNAIVWGLDNSNAVGSSCCQVLHAYDANSLNELYNSSQAPNNRDASGLALHFNEPTIANGKVYVGAQTELVIYGLLPQ